MKEFKQRAVYQSKFIHAAVNLLKPGGFLTYSTCTINAEENEEMVKYILDKYPSMKLIPIQATIGLPGRGGFGLSDCERGKVRRFEPHVMDNNADTIGFFMALFKKSLASP